MSYRVKMTIALTVIVGSLSLFAYTLPTFGRRCATVYEIGSAGYERCIDRLMLGGTVHFYKRTVMEPVNDQQQ
jgi:hypothetical protein